MRCLSCNEPLTPYERTRKALSGFYLDLCNGCYGPISNEVYTLGNPRFMEACDEEATLFDESVDNPGTDGYNSCIDEEGNLDKY